MRDFKQVKSLALRYLAYRERSEKEVFDYLIKKKFPQEIIEQTFGYLRRLNYLNDERFARYFAITRNRSKLEGKHRVQRELESKGIANELAIRTVHELYTEINEEELADACAKKKLRSLQKWDIPIQRRKLARFLERKGFSAHIILKMVNHFTPFERQTSSTESA